jgi:two-component system response regulator YesN
MIRVLIVDDETYTIDDLKQNINWNSLGITHVFAAESVSDALDITDRYSPELIISDIEMPSQNGLFLLERLRENNDNVPFIFLTCHPEFEYMQKAIRLGSCDYILKPVNYDELELSIYKIVSNEINLKKDTDINDVSIAKKARIYIENHLVEDIKISEIADSLFCSEHHLMRVFKQEYGWSIVEYITKERIRKAGELLMNTDWNITMISKMCGYDDSSYFTRVFKKAVGVTPSVYRKNKRGDE